MEKRIAECNCQQLRVVCTGEPDRVSVCHCLNCKKRTGSAFAWNASFPIDAVTVEGRYLTFRRKTDTDHTNIYHFCPDCGATIFYYVDIRPGMISVPAGAFADADFPKPTVEVFGQRKAGWCSLDLG